MRSGCYAVAVTRTDADRAASIEPAALVAGLRDARARTLALFADLSDAQLDVPLLEIVNPMLWELGHVVWFQERWTLRQLWHEPPRIEQADLLFDSTGVEHDSRWRLAMAPRERVLRYAADVLEALVERLQRGDAGADAAYFAQLALFHEDMHGEAFCYTRQTLGYPPPQPPGAIDPAADGGAGPCPGDVDVPGGTLRLGAERGGGGFVFDNEKWAHPVTVAPFHLARARVTQAELAAFVEDGGYRRRELWSEGGWQWRTAAAAELPVYWRRSGRGRGFERRHFDRWVPLEPHVPAHHVCWFEAEAFCRWAGRRLPTEAEWEHAATFDPRAPERKRRFPWGEELPTSDHAVLDGARLGCADVGACSRGDSALGLRQMVGGAWEWTASEFRPYPGFVADPYAEYSEPWFGSRRVLRGGAWATRARMLRNTWRNFFTPDRRDVIAGFRTAAL